MKLMMAGFFGQGWLTPQQQVTSWNLSHKHQTTNEQDECSTVADLIIKAIMINKSFRSQLQILYSAAGYKATGIALPCRSEVYLPNSIPNRQLTYKIDIAHRLYREYEKQNFKFSEKGVTPRMLAEEIAIFTHESDHCQIEIDSFGNILVCPTEAYLSEMKSCLIRGEVVQHYPIKVKNLQSEISSRVGNQKQSFLLSLEDLSLSSLRILFYLEILVRKRILLQECPAPNITKLIDLSKLKQPQIQSLLELPILKLTDCSIQVKTGRLAPKVGRRSLNVVDQFQSGELGPCLSGCLRHKFIQFYKANKPLFYHEDQILKFGEFFPDIHFSQLRSIYPQTYEAEILKLLRHTLNFDLILPINLRQTIHLPAIPSSRLPELLKNRNGLEEILLLIDAIGDDQIINCYHYLKARKGCLTEQPILDKISKTIELILT